MIRLLMIPQIGKQLNRSVKYFQSLMLYFLLPVKSTPSAVTPADHAKYRLTLIVEAVTFIHTSGLVVSSQQVKVLRITDLRAPGLLRLSSYAPLVQVPIHQLTFNAIINEITSTLNLPRST